MKHEQTYVRVNARVDIGIAELVDSLSRFPFVETLESCQGTPGEGEDACPAFVYFVCGRWQGMAEFVFGFLGPKLVDVADSAAMLSASTNGQGDPLVKIKMPAEVVSKVASVINELSVQTNAHSWEYSGDRPGT